MVDKLFKSRIWSLVALVLLCLLTRAAPIDTRCSPVEIDSNGKLQLSKCSIAYTKMILEMAMKITLAKTLPVLGRTRNTAVSSCKALLLSNPTTSSGIYWIDPNGGSRHDAFQAYCDQHTAGGGWTLVWSYTFTNYHSFTSSSNAVTPRPNWKVSSSNVPVSTTAPRGETNYNALNFSLWRQLGSEILIKSNINNWIVCKPGSGSLVLWKAGSLNCRLVKVVARKCPTRVPKNLRFYSFGPSLDYASHYYYFDGYTGDNWPTHDPCGNNEANQMSNISNPHGNIYVR